MAKKKAGAQPGNKHAVKLKDKDTRALAFTQLCEWISQGWAYKSFVFAYPGGEMTGEGIMEMARRHPDEFDYQKIEVANALSYQVWEKRVKESANGENPHASTATLQMVMRVKFGWDRKDSGGQSEVDKERFNFLSDWMDKAFREVKKKEDSKK